ncbi:hypothetical protein Trydic_g4094 [Trypoxylus dichotomus]
MLVRQNKPLRVLKHIFRSCHTNKTSTNEINNKHYVTLSESQPQQQKPDDSSGQFIKITRKEPGKVRLGLIPEEWFQFFYQKTGVTGPYVFLITVPSFFFSKEIYVLEHEYYSGLSVLIVFYLAVKKVGPHLAKAIDKGVDDYERKWTSNRDNDKKVFNDMIDNENKLQQSMEGQLMLQDAKKENVHLQLEEEYRQRLLVAYKTVKARLDFQVVKMLTEKKFLHRNLIEWVVNQVLAAYTSEAEKQTIDNCIQHLSTLSEKYKAAQVH